MLLKHKKGLFYSLSVVFGLALTLFAVNKDTTDDKFELTIGFGLPHACADTPYVPPSGGGGGSSGDGGDSDGSGGDDGSDGDDGGDSC